MSGWREFFIPVLGCYIIWVEMANIFLTHRCDRGCEFCFAKKGPWSIDYPKTDFDFQELIGCLDKLSHDKELNGIVGGEPFLYPQLKEVVEYMWSKNIIPKIFTSGTIKIPDSFRDLEIKGNLRFVVNVSNKDSYTKDQWENLVNFFVAYSRNITLSYTILDLHRDPVFLFDYIDEYNLNRTIRTGVALPISSGDNQFVRIQDYENLAEYFMEISRVAGSRHIRLATDCGFVACMFTIEQIGLLQAYGMDMRFCCGPAIDIGPRAEAWHCFPLSGLERINAAGYASIHMIKEKFTDLMNQYRRNGRKGIFDKCISCRYLDRGQCDGGCIAFIIMQENN